MNRARLALFVAAALLGSAVATPVGGPPVAAAATKPNVVVFYVDDVAPHDGRLWNNPEITPALYDLFTAHGLTFTSAIGETPLCCPGRAGLLTGLHTHNHGVLVNDARLFDPTEHIGREMKSAGYASMWIGKYFNLNNKLTSAQWNAHQQGWTYLDAILGENGAFYDYTVRTKSGDVYYPTTHSTDMVRQRTVSRLRQIPSTTPVFTILSVFDLHEPSTPPNRFVGDPRCADMPPWDPPNYNEADVSDKPAFIQSLPLLPYPDGYPMVTYCEEMLGIDAMVKRVVDELKADGRYDNTMFVFTADNGVTWGQHRNERKLVPYAAPVPLYFSWPARWGSSPRTIRDAASNIDLAPTFCAVGGCAMNDYADGRPGPDGLSLMPLLDGNSATLGRNAVLESAWSGLRKWTGIRTTRFSSLGLWHYVEWDTGERELYDEVNDPWELQNVAGLPAYAGVQSALASQLASLRVEHARARPDAAIALSSTGPWKGNWVITAAPSTLQTVSRTITAGYSSRYYVRITNRGGYRDSFRVYGYSTGTTDVTVSYFSGTTDITAAVAAGTYRTGVLPILGEQVITIKVAARSYAADGATKRVDVTVRSTTDSSHLDVVRAVAVVG